jgi:hypothetical protein
MAGTLRRDIERGWYHVINRRPGKAADFSNERASGRTNQNGIGNSAALTGLLRVLSPSKFESLGVTLFGCPLSFTQKRSKTYLTMPG